MTGPQLAAALGAVLEEWSVTGYLPPAAVWCGAVDIYTGDWCKRLASECRAPSDGTTHSYDGRAPWPDDTEENR